MTPSTARGLARGGALLAVVSLLAPWYVLEAHGLRAEGKSGVAALGIWSVVLVVLAVAAVLPAAGRAHRFLPSAAAAALGLLVLVKLLAPPSAASGFGSGGGDELSRQFEDAFAQAISKAVGLHYAPTWGIWLAALGVAVVLIGAVVAALSEPG